MILYDPGHGPLVVTSAEVNVGTLQLSVAVGVVHEGVAEHSMVVGPGRPEMTGGTVSSTLIVWVATVTLPHRSVAVHVRVMLNSFGHEPLVVTSANVNVGTPQLSVADGVVKEGVPEHSIVVAPGNAEMTGGIVSSTLIVCVATVTLPHRSVAVQVRVMLNSFGHEPLVVTSINVKVGTPQLSVAVGVVNDGVPEHSIVVAPGRAEITGGTVSSTLIVWVATAVLPHKSVAVQVRVMLNSFGHEPFVVTSLNIKVGAPQLSVAVGVAKDGVAEHSIVVGAGKPEMTGGVVSSTLMVCVAVAVLPQRSVDVQVRVMLNSFGQEPFVVTSAKPKEGIPQLSVAVGVVQEGTTEHSIVVGAGKPEITGGVVSSTLIVWEAVAVFPQPSLAVQVRVILNSFGHEPLVVTSTNVRVGVEQLSVAIGVVHEGATEHSIVVGPGSGDITGGMVSSTLIVWVAVEVLPHSSVAVQVRVILYSFGQLPLVVTSAEVNIGVPQLSVTVGVVHVGVPEHSIVVGPGSAEITGGVESTTLMTCSAVVVFPHSSVAVQVLVMVYESGHAPEVVTELKVRAGLLQLSVAVGTVHEGTAVHSMVEGAGSAEITGGVVSVTLMT